MVRRNPKPPLPKRAIVRRELTPAEARQIEGAREEELARENQHRASLASVRKALESGEQALDSAMSLLREERTRQGLSLADIQKKTGIARSQLSQLENATAPNPTITTVCRVADALGMNVAIRLVRKRRPASKSA